MANETDQTDERPLSPEGRARVAGLKRANLEDIARRASLFAEQVMKTYPSRELDDEARDLWNRVMAHEAIYGDLK